MNKTFNRIKTQSLNRLDLSKKGSIDEHIEHVVSLLNSCEQFFTTSSCSGRIILIDKGDLNFLSPAEAVNTMRLNISSTLLSGSELVDKLCRHCGREDKEDQMWAAGSSDAHKQNCVWLFVSHQTCTCDDLMSGLSRSCGDAVLKFEPFILHVQCRKLEDAQLLHSVAVNSGFRNSGLTVGKTGKIVSAVRSTHGLEVPLSCHGKLLVDEDYIQFLTQIANQKMEENLRRVQRFFQNLQSAMSAERQHISDTLGTQEHQDSQHTHKKGRRGEQGTNKQNEINVNKQRHQHETDSCHGYEDSSLPELDDCLDLFT